MNLLIFAYLMNSYELQRREADIKRRRQTEEEKRKSKELPKLKQREDGMY
jgi:hypothetical protein